MLKFNNKVLHINDKWLNPSGSPVPPVPDPYNPLNLPPNTVRVRTKDGNVPYKGDKASYETATLVQGTTDVYDVYKSGTDFTNLFRDSSNVIEVLGANTTGIKYMSRMFLSCPITSVSLFDTTNVTKMDNMFNYCSKLTSIPLFDTTNVTNMDHMFNYCSNLRFVPLFNTSNVTNMNHMFNECSNLTNIKLFDTTNVTTMSYTFYNCYNVQGGALALYQQASSQTTPPSKHSGTFRECGTKTQIGIIEYNQIPSDWK